ncbi:MAG: dihydropteroate synthase [Candidatus Neomarinimicrobiota bacterium]
MNIKDFFDWRDEPFKKTLIMGILNVTPDSFSDGGLYLNCESAVKRALEMVNEGADIIDIGGESTRPGSIPVSFEIELNRVIPVIKAIRKKTDCMLSIDTYKSKIAKAAFKAGADMLNDISGLSFDKMMAKTAAKYNVPVIIMHIQGKPLDMHDNPQYENLMEEVMNYFRERLSQASAEGIYEKNIILDPGLGFGKRSEDNFELIRELKQITTLGFPVLLGPSRKSFIGHVLKTPIKDRIEGTSALVTAGILNGCNIIRVHDVKIMKRVAVITDRLKGKSANDII